MTWLKFKAEYQHIKHDRGVDAYKCINCTCNGAGGYKRYYIS